VALIVMVLMAVMTVIVSNKMIIAAIDVTTMVESRLLSSLLVDRLVPGARLYMNVGEVIAPVAVPDGRAKVSRGSRIKEKMIRTIDRTERTPPTKDLLPEQSHS
jgi:hypothetical protein